jgi:hypothetical protein
VTRSGKKAAITGAVSAVLLLALTPMIPFAGSDRSVWFVNRRGWE